ncbi:MAG TPA: hypothetical protein VIY47_13345, partial [Ignavibacteriaceae bacterium]
MISKKKSLFIGAMIAIVVFFQCRPFDPFPDHDPPNPLVNQGKQIFRFDAFGDEDFWSGLLHIDKAIAGAANGGFGPGVSPRTALTVGLKVDA